MATVGGGNGAPQKVTAWAGTGRLRVVAVRLAGAHRVWSDFMGAAPGADAAFLVTDAGRIVGRGYFPSVEELAEVVDLATLSPAGPPRRDRKG